MFGADTFRIDVVANRTEAASTRSGTVKEQNLSWKEMGKYSCFSLLVCFLVSLSVCLYLRLHIIAFRCLSLEKI